MHLINHKVCGIEVSVEELSEEWTMDTHGLSNLARDEAERTDGVHKASVSQTRSGCRSQRRNNDIQRPSPEFIRGWPLSF